MKESITDRQTVFNITDENYEAYEKLNLIKRNAVLPSELKTIIKICITGVVGAAAIVGLSFFLTTNIVQILDLSKNISNLGTAAGAVSLATIDSIGIIAWMIGLTSIVCKLRLKKFKKEYPNIDTNVDLESLEKALTKYNELKKVPKDIEKKKEQFLTNHSEEFKTKTTEERINELKKELEFWEQVKIEEKYKSDTVEQVKTLKKTHNPNN